MTKTSSAYEYEHSNACLNKFDVVSHYNSSCRRSFNQDAMNNFEQMLTHYTANSFYDNSWNITVASSGQSALIRFPPLQLEDSTLLRVAVLEYLVQNASIGSSKRIIYDAVSFFDFLDKQKIYIENCRSGVFSMYASHLESLHAINNSQRNNLLRAAAHLIQICSVYGLLQGNGVIDCTYRFVENRAIRRAPDTCVVKSLDAIFFDITRDIPNAYRCIYLLLRLIPNRISEVLAMNIDCLSYPEPDVFAVSIPTMKETPYHIPTYNTYNRKLSGWCEGLLYESIRRQQEKAEKYYGYLFVSPYSSKLITITEFNSFLAHTVKDNHILDARGELASISSHSLRHIAIGERLRNDIISPTLTMIEATHFAIEQTMAYSYQSLHDEAKYLGDITSAVLRDTRGNGNKFAEAKPNNIPEHKYNHLFSQPYTRIIPGYGICCNMSCSPRYEGCFKCRSFEPDEVYLEYIEAGISFINRKIAKLEDKHGDPKAIEFNKRQLETYQLFVKKLRESQSQQFQAV